MAVHANPFAEWWNPVSDDSVGSTRSPHIAESDSPLLLPSRSSPHKRPLEEGLPPSMASSAKVWQLGHRKSPRVGAERERSESADLAMPLPPKRNGGCEWCGRPIIEGGEMRPHARTECGMFGHRWCWNFHLIGNGECPVTGVFPDN